MARCWAGGTPPRKTNVSVPRLTPDRSVRTITSPCPGLESVTGRISPQPGARSQNACASVRKLDMLIDAISTEPDGSSCRAGTHLEARLSHGGRYVRLLGDLGCDALASTMQARGDRRLPDAQRTRGLVIGESQNVDGN